MGLTVIHSVRLFDGTDVHDTSTVTFDSSTGKITSVSTAGNGHQDTPSGAEVIDGKGHTLLPGLIDAHVHVHDLHLPPGGDHDQVLKSPLKCGVTTICDMHSDPVIVHKLRNDIKKEEESVKAGGGSITRSDLKSSLYGATIKGGWPKPIVLGHNPTEEVRWIPDNDTWSLTAPEASCNCSNMAISRARYSRSIHQVP